MISIISILLLFATVAFRANPISASSSSSCVPAGNTGLTAFMVASSHQKITGAIIDATGCDVGIFVGPGTTDVRITGNTVRGANDHGIFVQDTSDITISHNLVTENGFESKTHTCSIIAQPCVEEDKAIQLVGTSDSVIAHNIVSGNPSDGGIGIADDGPVNPGGFSFCTFHGLGVYPCQPTKYAGSPRPANNNLVEGNVIAGNLDGCGLIVSAYNSYQGAANNQFINNTIIGVAPLPNNGGPYGGPGSYIGQIVIAVDYPNSTISNTKVIGNTLDGSILPGIAVHSNLFGDRIDGTLIRDNRLSNNGYYPFFFAPTGDTNAPLANSISNAISLVAEVGFQPPNTQNPAISHTTIKSNTVVGDNNGVWLCYTDHTTIKDLDGNPTHPVTVCPAGVGS